MKRLVCTQSKKDRQSQSGFTIVELMIATVVFSLVLTVIIFGILSFSRAYFGGVNASTTQDTARNIMSNMTQAIEFSGNNITPITNVSGDTYYFCAGGLSYYFIMGQEYDGATPSSGDPGLYVTPGSCNGSPSFSGGTELLGNRERITYLSVQQLSSGSRLYTVGLELAYGDNDLLCSVTAGTGTGGCSSSTVYPPAVDIKSTGTTPLTDIQCRRTAGFQFCAHTALSATVSLRVANSALM